MRARVEIGSQAKREIANFLNIASVRYPKTDVTMDLSSAGIHLCCGNMTMKIEPERGTVHGPHGNPRY